MSQRTINQDPPASSHPDIVSAVAASAQELGLSTKHMVSRAYHDSLFMARWALLWGVVSGCSRGGAGEVGSCGEGPDGSRERGFWFFMPRWAADP